MRRAQLSFGDGLIAAEVDDLCEDWMKHADQVLADELPGRGRCRILLRQERDGGEGKGRQARLHSQSLHQKPRAQTRTEEALVPQRPEMADRMRGTHQRDQTATWAQLLPL